MLDVFGKGVSILDVSMRMAEGKETERHDRKSRVEWNFPQ